MDRRKKSRENREQLRCCNWIQLPIGPILETVSGVKAGTRYDAAQASQARSQNICPVHLIRGSAVAAVYDRRFEKLRHTDSALIERRYRKASAKKLLRRKKNESWAMRFAVAIGDQKPPLHGKQVRLSELEKTCYAKSFSLVSGARAFCPLYPAFCRRLFRGDAPKAGPSCEKVRFTEKTEAVRQNAGAPLQKMDALHACVFLTDRSLGRARATTNANPITHRSRGGVSRRVSDAF